MSHAGRIVAALGPDLRELAWRGPRARQCLMAAVTVVVSVQLAALAHLPDLWWAGISGFMSLQATHPASVRKSLLRVSGTAAGAVLAVLLLPFLAYDQVALALALWGFAALAILAFMVSPHGYAWLFLAITFILVLLLSMSDPLLVTHTAATRTAEVTIGSAVAVIVTWTLAERAGPGAVAIPPPAPPPGWTGLLGVRFPVVLFALRGGFAVMLMPLLWRALELPSLAQMPVTVAAVMAVPVAIADPKGRDAVVLGRALQRLIGCFLGGAIGLLCLSLAVTDFASWLALLAAGVWVCSHVQASPRGIGYVGTQAAIALILTLVQGAGPPTSILPGIDRFVGVTSGLAVLLAVSALLDFVFVARPADADRPAAQGAS